MYIKSPIVAAVDIGTTKICAVVARRGDNGKMEILGVGKADSSGVKRGVISNIDKTVNAIISAVNQAKKRANVDVHNVYVGIAGQHINCLQHRGYITRNNQQDEINKEDIARLIQDMHKVALPPGDKILHVFPQEYIVDHQTDIKDPIGMSGIRMEADFHIVTGQIAAIQNIFKCIEKANLNAVSLVLEPIASSGSVLSDKEKEAGVALVDIGGGTTDIAIYQDGFIRHSAVIPLGGNIITEDIKEGCLVMKEQAEKLKVKFGCALAGEAKDNEIVSIKGLRGREPKEISIKNLAHIIQARMEEILEFVFYEIKRSGFEDKLIAGMVITGGGARLNSLEKLAQYLTGMPVRIGYPVEHLHNAKKELRDPIFATSVGLALVALNEENVVYTEPTKAAEPEPVVEIKEAEPEEEYDLEPAGEGSWWGKIVRRSREWLEGDVNEFS